MRLMTVVMIGLGAAAGYAAVRVLLDNESLAERAPGPLGGAVAGATASLQRARVRVAAAIIEGDAARVQAERELTAEYRERSGHR